MGVGVGAPVVYAYIEDGVEVIRGTVPELARHFQCSRGYIYDHIKEFKRIGTRPFHATTESTIKKTRKQEEMGYLLRHLKRYGNTSCSFDPVPYFPDLLDQGLDCRISGIYPNSMTSVTKRHRRNDVHYIVEVVKDGLPDIHN